MSAELPGGGWPCGALTELLLDACGLGELQLLRPALASLSSRRRVALVQPPAIPNRDAWLAWGLDPSRLLWVQPEHLNDALWCAEQILRNGSCAALLCWLPQVPGAALRRLHGAAQETDTLFVAFRPLGAAQRASAAVLRLALHPAPGGVAVRVVKRRGPPRDLPIFVPLHAPAPVAPLLPVTLLPHGTLDLSAPVASEPGRIVF
ncbi:translesion DNA synthesis-associated protein ImuA [Verticiella sediminum]